MDGPGGRYDSLLTRNQQMSCFLRLSHKVKYPLSFRNIEIEIGFHPPGMGVGGHRIPDAARLQDGQAHYQLTALYAIGMNIFIDRPRIRSLRAADIGRLGLLAREELHGMGCMRLRGQNLEQRGIGRVVACEAYLLDPFSSIKTIELSQFICRIVRIDLTLPADIDDSDLPALQKIIRL
jgi:hypothetical protein